MKNVLRGAFGLGFGLAALGCGGGDAVTATGDGTPGTTTTTTSSGEGGAGGGATTTTSAGGAGGATTTTSAGGAGGATTTTSAGGAGGAGGATTTTSAGGAGGAGGATTTSAGGAGGAAQICQPNAAESCYTGPAGTVNIGACAPGSRTCAADGLSWGPCVGEVLPTQETCKTPVDDDCNGVANEGGLDCACVPKAVQACYSGPPGTENVGICLSGTQTCADDGTGWGPCVGEILPAVESCLTVADEDCDGNAPKCTGDYDWQKRAGDALAQAGRAVALGGEGVAIVAGQFQGVLDLGAGPMVSAGSDDAFVARLNAATGDCSWSKRFGDVSSQKALGVAVTPVGDVLVAGEFAGMVNLGGGPLNSSGSTDVFVGKLDALGNHVWSKRFGNNAAQTVGGIATDKDGNVYVVGSFAGSIDFGGNVLTSAGLNDIYLAKLDPQGNHVWSQRFGNGSDQIAHGIAVDLAGEVVITGGLQGTVNFGGAALASAGSWDIYLAKFDTAGNHLWSKKWGDASAQQGRGVAFDATGAIALTGELGGQVNLGGGPLKSAGSTDVFLAKFTGAGDHLWSQRFGNVSAQSANGVSIDPSGAVVIVGDVAGTVDFGGGVLTSAGSTDVFLAKFDGLGNPVWSKIYGNVAAQTGLAVAAGSSAVLLTGTVQGSINFGGGPLNSAGSTDLFVAAVAP